MKLFSPPALQLHPEHTFQGIICSSFVTSIMILGKCTRPASRGLYIIVWVFFFFFSGQRADEKRPVHGTDKHIFRNEITSLFLLCRLEHICTCVSRRGLRPCAVSTSQRLCVVYSLHHSRAHEHSFRLRRANYSCHQVAKAERSIVRKRGGGGKRVLVERRVSWFRIFYLRWKDTETAWC